MTRRLKPDRKTLKRIFKTSFNWGPEEDIRPAYYLEVGKGSKKKALPLKHIVLAQVIDCFLFSCLAPVAKKKNQDFPLLRSQIKSILDPKSFLAFSPTI